LKITPPGASALILHTIGISICNACDELDYFPISETVITIEKKDFKANWMRLRVDPGDNTTGTIDIRITYKTFP
jgi:hypothetical protein